MFSARESSEASIAAGAAAGYLTSTSLGPLATTELEIRVEGTAK